MRKNACKQKTIEDCISTGRQGISTRQETPSLQSNSLNEFTTPSKLGAEPK